MNNCENCESETSTIVCVDCGCKLCDECKITIDGKLYCNTCDELYLDEMM